MRTLLQVFPTFFVLAPIVYGPAAAHDAVSPVAVPISATTSDGDAAAKHAKRTACLKEAKTRKLVGAQKAAFLKECVAAP